MSRNPVDRREFLTLPLKLFLTVPMASVLAPWGRGFAQTGSRNGSYSVDLALLYGALNLQMTGTTDESVDRAAGRYDVKVVGEGSRIANRVESHGVLQSGRWVPVRTMSWFKIAGRESHSDVTYDHERRSIRYRFRGETFFLRRLRVADDLVAMPDARVDDSFSALLNYAEGRWASEPDGTFRTLIVRRRRPEREGPDDVQEAYRAELVPFLLRVTTDPQTGKSTALFDLTRFSSWARNDKPAQIQFGPDRRPESIASSLMLGTSFTIRFETAV